jgi:hypothetical protein
MGDGQQTFFPMCLNVVVEIISIEFECHCMSWEVHVWTLDNDCLVSRCMWGVWSVNILSIQKCSIGSDCYRKSMMHVTFKFQYDSMILFLLFRQKKNFRLPIINYQYIITPIFVPIDSATFLFQMSICFEV